MEKENKKCPKCRNDLMLSGDSTSPSIFVSDHYSSDGSSLNPDYECTNPDCDYLISKEEMITEE